MFLTNNSPDLYALALCILFRKKTCFKHRVITMHARPRRTDRQTDGRMNIMAIARWFVPQTHSALKLDKHMNSKLISESSYTQSAAYSGMGLRIGHEVTEWRRSDYFNILDENNASSSRLTNDWRWLIDHGRRFVGGQGTFPPTFWSGRDALCFVPLLFWG